MNTLKQQRNKSRKIFISAGEPCGIGTEIILKAFAKIPSFHYHKFRVVGYASTFREASRTLVLHAPFRFVTFTEWMSEKYPTNKEILFLDLFSDIHSPRTIPKHPDKTSGHMTLKILDTLIRVFQKDPKNILVTAPVCKFNIMDNDPNFIGQTEYLGKAFNTSTKMLMWHPSIAVALLSNHVPLKEITKHISEKNIVQSIHIIREFFKKHFQCANPKIAMCALNPHAGENGKIGMEEQNILIPTIQKLQRLNIYIEGPFPADTIFLKRKQYDVFLTLYHDQGLIAFKSLTNREGLNLTMGLPFPRISVDHGPAIDITGLGIANATGMLNAFKHALKLQESFQ